ncbi:MAG: PDZ domain-containing protein [Polyangiales bacterium]
MPVRHQIAVADANAHLVTVTSTFTAEGGALPDPLVVAMPVWTPGSYLVREYARNVELPRARVGGERVLAVTKVRKNAWSIAHGGAPEVVFAYDLYCNDVSVRTNHVDDTHVYLNGAATFTFATHEPSGGADVVIDAPSGWKIATALRPLGGATFRAESFDELVDSPIHVADHATRRFDVLGKPHHFAVWGEAPNAQWDEVARDTRLIIETEARFFGGTLPYDEYTFLWLVTPRNRGGLEHRASTTLTVQPQLFDDRKGYLDVLSLVAHEYFHLWNVKRIRPQGLSPYRYEEENYTRLLWWFEGATSYYDWRVLRVSGLCTVDEYLDHLGEEISRLEDTPGRMQQSCCEASFDAWIKLYRADENTVNSTISYYLKGEIVCALLDVELRARTHGQRGLDDVLAELWRAHGVEEKPVPEDAMAALFDRVAGVPMHDVLAAWTEGRGELPIDATLAKVGLKLVRERGHEKRQRPSLGVRVRAVDGRCVVVSILRGRAAHKGGIDTGDELVAVGGKRVEGGKVDATLLGRAPGSTVDVVVARDGQLRTVSCTLDAPTVDRVRVVIADGASAAQRSLLEGWLHGTPTAKEKP